jgi:SAM-dependent methyltransferase
MTDLPRMYTDMAEYWTLISDPADYAQQAAHWRQALHARLDRDRHRPARLLELGIGGGNNLSHFVEEFQAVGVDLSARMLEQARRIVPAVRLVQGDMRTVRLGETFEAVLIHDAIMYMTTADDLRAVFETAQAHLAPGGLLLTAPDWVRETFPGTHAATNTASDEAGDTTLTIFEYEYDPDPSDTTMVYRVWYLLRRGGELTVTDDHHTLGLFPRATWLTLLDEAGFDVELIDYPGDREAHLYSGVLRG